MRERELPSGKTRSQKQRFRMGGPSKIENARCSGSGTASAKRRFRVRGVSKNGHNNKTTRSARNRFTEAKWSLSKNLREGSLRHGGGVPTIIFIKNQ